MFSSLSKGIGAPGISVSETQCLEPIAQYNWMVSILPFVLFCRLILLLIGFKILKTIWESDGRNWLVIIWIIIYCCLKLPQNLRPGTVIIDDPVFFCGSVIQEQLGWGVLAWSFLQDCGSAFPGASVTCRLHQDLFNMPSSMVTHCCWRWVVGLTVSTRKPLCRTTGASSRHPGWLPQTVI